MNLNLKVKNNKLAINGGIPLRTKIWQDNFTTGKEEIEALTRVVNSGYLSLFEGSHTPDAPFSFSGGPEVVNLEKEWGKYYNVDSELVVSMNSATSGLYAAIGALEIGFGDEVIVSPYTMSACAVAPMLFGAIPVFADVDLNTGSLSPESIEARITKRTKAILVVHQFGIPAQMDKIMEIAKKNNLKVIEDCAQAHGAKFNNQFVGTIGDVGVFSLNVNKTIQSGEGGVCIAKSSEVAYRLKLIRNHGEAVVGPAKYENIVNIVGQNYRMTELQAAVSVEQLKKLNNLNSLRLEMVNYLREELSKFDCLKLLTPPKNSFPTFYVFPLRYVGGSELSREEFVKTLNAEGVVMYQGYVKPLYTQPLYQQKMLFKHGYPFSAPENKECYQNYSLGICPNAEQLHFKEMLINEHIRYPHNLEDMKDIVNIFEKVLS